MSPPRTSARNRKGIDGYLLVSAFLFVGLILSLTAMQMAFNSGNRHRVQLLAVCSAACVIGSSQFFMFWVIRHNERERLEKLGHTPDPVFNLNEDYRARHDVSDPTIFLILTVGSLLLVFRVADGKHLFVVFLCSAMSLFCFASFYKSLFFSVLFTEKLIIVEMKPFIKYSESYDSVTAIHFMPGNRKVIFCDGKSVNLGYGLGDSRRIAAILQKHVDVLPEERSHWL